MKKELRLIKLLFAIVVISIAISIILFNLNLNVQASTADGTSARLNSEIVRIDKSHLAYDTYTKVVYIFNRTYGHLYSNIVYTEYLSENLNHCKYIDGQIVEVDDNGNVIDKEEN